MQGYYEVRAFKLTVNYARPIIILARIFARKTSNMSNLYYTGIMLLVKALKYIYYGRGSAWIETNHIH